MIRQSRGSAPERVCAATLHVRRRGIAICMGQLGSGSIQMQAFKHGLGLRLRSCQDHLGAGCGCLDEKLLKRNRATCIEIGHQLQPQEDGARRSEEHTSELQSLMRTSYTAFCLKTTRNNTLLTQQN